MKKLLVIVVLFVVQVIGQSPLDSLLKFHKLYGSVTVLNGQTGEIISSDMLDANTGTLPASTFKIMNSLISLELGVVKGLDDKFYWKGQDSAAMVNYPAVCRDLTHYEAFAMSALWVYIELAEKVGHKNYMKYLNELGYGNGLTEEMPRAFWINGDFRVTPIQQLTVLRKIFTGQTSFSSDNIAKLKQLMLRDERADHKLYGKTGWAQKDRNIGWFVGFVEKNNGEVYYFASRLQTKGLEHPDDFFGIRKQAADLYLKEQGIIR